MRRRLANLRHRHLYAVTRELRAAFARDDADRLAVDAASVVRAQTDVGELLLHADDQVMTPHIREHRCWEADEGEWLRGVLAPGLRVVDVGANVGYFTVLMSRLVGARGSVVAVEPDRDNLRLLRLNLWLNGCHNVTVWPLAAWRERDVLTLRRSPTNRGDHQVHETGGDVLVAAAPLDDLLDGPVDVAKIDTQGVDHEVLAGARRVLGGAHVLVEFWTEGMRARGVDPTSVLTGYRAAWTVGLLSGPADDAAILAATEWEGHWVNLALSPA